MSIAGAINLADVRELARRRMPRLFFDYIDGGSHGEITMRANRADFEALRLAPRVLRDVGTVGLATRFWGQDHALPLMLAPVGYLGLYGYRGDIAAGRAAAAAGIPVGISTFSIAAFEDVAGESGGRAACQFYVFRDRALTRDMLDRARAAGIGTIIVTVDTPVTPLRERDERNGFRKLTSLGPGHLFDMALHPRWSLDMLRYGRMEVANVARYNLGQGVMETTGRLAREIDPALTFDDLAWLRAEWQGRLQLKGVMHPADALRCAAIGVDGLIVSNHGGRQLDQSPSTIAALPAIRRAVGPDLELVLDSGVRRGADIVLALALGADAVGIGRPYAFGVGAAGEAGVAKVIDLLAQELRSSLALVGATSIDELKAMAPDQVLFGRNEGL